MTRTLKLSVLVIAIIGLVGIGALVTGIVRVPVAERYAHPPCGELPSPAEVEQAIESHSSFVARLTAAGPGIEVVVGKPCPDPEQAVLTVRVSTDEEEAAVRAILAQNPGLGVPIVIERR